MQVMLVEGTCSVIFVQGLLVIAEERPVRELPLLRCVIEALLVVRRRPHILKDHRHRCLMTVLGARVTSARPEDLANEAVKGADAVTKTGRTSSVSG